MEAISVELRDIVDENQKKLNGITKEDWEYKSDPAKWSKKEILGHLIDSAANNHQRFVRIQFEDTPIITYDQNKWSAVQDYNNAPLEDLINLWTSYNRHLAYIVSKLPEEKYNNQCNIGKEQPVTIEWIITDYVLHLKHHLSQITGKV